jgi:hypothetical protein
MENIMSMKIAIVRDNCSFGERTFKTLSKEFETKIIEINSPKGIFIDNIEIEKELIDEITEFDLIITYIKQADMTLELIEQIHKKVSWIIVGIWKGEGFKNQLLKYGNVSVPDNMCELEGNFNDPIINKFLEKFGKPKIKINCQGEKIAEIEIVRGAPCGATEFIAKDMIGKDSKNAESLAKQAGLRVQHYPCKGHKLRLFSDEDSHKQIASQLHYNAVETAIKENKKSKNKNLKKSE